MEHELLSFASIPSTSLYLKEHHDSLQDGTVVKAFHQSQGRGRLGREWIDDDGSLLFSILLKGEEYGSLLATLPLLSGAAMEITLLEKGINPSIKWPNDIYLNDKKCCGILVEGIYQEKLASLIVGIGLNVNNEAFPPSLINATSLYLEERKKFDKDELLNRFLRHFDDLLEKQKSGDNAYLPITKEHDYLQGKHIYLNYYGEKQSVIALGINENGVLVVKNEKGEIFSVTSGEATILKEHEPSEQ